MDPDRKAIRLTAIMYSGLTAAVALLIYFTKCGGS